MMQLRPRQRNEACGPKGIDEETNTEFVGGGNVGIAAQALRDETWHLVGQPVKNHTDQSERQERGQHGSTCRASRNVLRGIPGEPRDVPIRNLRLIECSKISAKARFEILNRGGIDLREELTSLRQPSTDSILLLERVIHRVVREHF